MLQQPEQTQPRDQREEVLDYLKGASLTELGPVMEVLATKVDQYRRDNSGYVPFEVFPHVLGIAGQYTCIEWIPKVVDSEGALKGFLLKRRGDGEQGWEDQYQIPGVAIVPVPQNDLMQLAEKRLQVELNIPNLDENMVQGQQAIGFEAHAEPERNTTCLTLQMTVELTEAVCDQLQRTAWKFFDLQNLRDSQIVNHHQATLDWVVRRGDRKDFELVDLRSF